MAFHFHLWFLDSGFTSMVMTPDHPELTFTLEQLRSEPTFQQPRQEWQFVSDYAVCKFQTFKQSYIFYQYNFINFSL